MKTKAGLSVFWGVGSFQALAMFRRGLFYTYLSIYLRYYLGLTVTETTLFATLPMLANIIAQTFIWGRLSDRLQLRRTLILWGEFSGASGTVLIWTFHVMAPSPAQAGYTIILGLTVVEFFWAMSNIGWSALISDLYPEKKRNEVQGRLASVGGLGRLFGIWIGGQLYDSLGLMYEGWGFESGVLFFVAAGIMLIAMVPVMLLPEGGRDGTTLENYDCGPLCRAESLRLYIVFLFAMTFINFGRNCVATIQSQYLFLESGFAVNSQTLSYIVNTESAAIILLGLFSGKIGRRIGNGRAVCAGALASVFYLLIFIFSDQLYFIFAASFLRGTGDVIILAASYAMASVLIPPESRGRWFGYFNATLFLSWGVAGTLIAGPVVDAMEILGYAPAVAYRMAYVAALFMTLTGLAIQIVLVFILLPKAGIHKVAA